MYETTQKRVIRVLGTAFSGSTLLNRLMNVQAGVRGLSEAWHWFNPDTDAYCPNCKGPMTTCHMAEYRNKQDFWQRMFDKYPDTYALVDTSKHPSLIWGKMPPVPAEYRQQIILLTKSPHEFAWSYVKHKPQANVAEAFRTWIEVHQCILRYVFVAIGKNENVQLKHHVTPIAKEDVVSVRYKDLTQDTYQAVSNILIKLGMIYDFDTEIDKWCEPSDTCMLGGNNAIYAQGVAETKFFASESTYLGGKYADKKGVIFYDDQWKTDLRFVEDCIRLYRDAGMSVAIQELSDLLGYGVFATTTFIKELRVASNPYKRHQ